MLGTLKLEYDRCIISLRESSGISAGEMYKLKISKVRSSKDRLVQSSRQFGGRDGIVSGMNKPLSGARPFKTASSNETCNS
jgi:hypothetical protein